MKIPDRDTAVFSTSAIDLFASALGAFILLVMLLFPYYRHGGTDDAFSQTWDLMEKRRLTSGTIEEMEAQKDEMQSELEILTEANEGTESSLSLKRTELRDLERQLADLPVTISEPVVDIPPEPVPLARTDGVEFSILGLASESKSFVIVIDMSGSMMNYEKLMLRSVLEILAPLDESNQFAIVGYQGNPQPVLWRYPGHTGLLTASEENLHQAREFVRGLSNKFIGSTPTHLALEAALEYPANAVILMSDGEPNTAPGYIIQDISNQNQFRQSEIHTVAIGEYTHNRNLVLFLQTLSRLNNGDFVGVSR